MLFVLTRRDKPDRPAADALLADLAGRGVEAAELELGPLSAVELAAVARSVADLTEHAVDQVVRAADGNPLLAVESARALTAGRAAPPQNLRAAVRAATGVLARPARDLAELLAAAGRGPGDTIVAEMANTELMSLIRLGRFTECEAVAERGGAAAQRSGRLDLAYGIWIQTACALSGAGQLTGALRAVDAAVAATRGMTVIELPCLAGRAFVLSRLGRHAEALEVAVELLAKAERMDSSAAVALARHDAGLIALAAGRHAERPSCSSRHWPGGRR